MFEITLHIAWSITPCRRRRRRGNNLVVVEITTVTELIADSLPASEDSPDLQDLDSIPEVGVEACPASTCFSACLSSTFDNFHSFIVVFCCPDRTFSSSTHSSCIER